MTVELFSLCDSAHDYGGKLVVSGTFDTIHAREVPATHPIMGIAARMRFPIDELGTHEVKVEIVGENGRVNLVALEGTLEVGRSVHNTSIANLAFNLPGVQIASYGEFSVNLIVDAQQAARVPLYVIPAR